MRKLYFNFNFWYQHLQGRIENTKYYFQASIACHLVSNNVFYEFSTHNFESGYHALTFYSMITTVNTDILFQYRSAMVVYIRGSIFSR